MDSMHVTAVCVFGLLALGLAHGKKPWYCGEQSCPDFTTLKTGRYDIREYGETKWVATTSQLSKPYAPTRKLRAMFSIIWPYFKGENDKGISVSLAVPAMMRVQLVRKNLYNHTMMWYLPEEPLIPTSSKVFIITRPAGDIFVSDFQGKRWPKEKTFITKYKKLVKKIGNKSLYRPGLFYRVSYNYPFDRNNKQHEVWLDKI